MILIKEIEVLPEEKAKLPKFISHFTIPVAKSKELTSYGKTLPSDKAFLSLETENDFRVTRIRSSIDIMRPMIITQISKSNDAMSYKMRIGKVSALILFVLLLMNLFSISSIALKQEAAYYPYFIFALLTFLFFLHHETKITERELREAFKRIKK